MDLFPTFRYEFLPGMHKLTLLFGLVAVALNIMGELRNRKSKLAYNFEVVPMNMFIMKLIVVSAIISGITWVLAGYNGMSWTVVIMLLVVAVYHYISTKTVLGRYIYAIGGNPEAAELSGIDVKRLTYVVFGSMGMMAALSASCSLRACNPPPLPRVNCSRWTPSRRLTWAVFRPPAVWAR